MLFLNISVGGTLHFVVLYRIHTHTHIYIFYTFDMSGTLIHLLVDRRGGGAGGWVGGVAEGK